MKTRFETEHAHIAEIKYLSDVRGRFAKAGVTKMVHLCPPCDTLEEINRNHSHSELVEDVADWTQGDDEARSEWAKRMADGDTEIERLLLEEIEGWERLNSDERELICEAILDGSFFSSEIAPVEMPGR